MIFYFPSWKNKQTIFYTWDTGNSSKSRLKHLSLELEVNKMEIKCTAITEFHPQWYSTLWESNLDYIISTKVLRANLLLLFQNTKYVYYQPNKIMAYLTIHKWLVSVCDIHNDIMNGTNQNQSLGKSELRYYFIRLTIFK